MRKLEKQASAVFWKPRENNPPTRKGKIPCVKWDPVGAFTSAVSGERGVDVRQDGDGGADKSENSP